MACADLEVRPAPLSKADGALTSKARLATQVTGESTAGYNTTLKAGSLWRLVGTMQEGQVYRPLTTSVAARAYDDSEAFIVVQSGQWVGFWLPYEEAYSPLDHPVTIELSLLQGEQQ